LGAQIVDERTPHVELMNFEAIELEEIIVRRLEKCPLITVEIDREDVRQASMRVETERVENLHPDINIAI
jgi:hypothetical protein